MTAEELLLVALAFIVTLKRNRLLASSLIFTITFFFSSYRVQAWSPPGWWQQVNCRCKRAPHLTVSPQAAAVSGWAAVFGVTALLGCRKGGPKPAAGTPLLRAGLTMAWGCWKILRQVLCFDEEDLGPPCPPSAHQVPLPYIWVPGLLSPCPKPAPRAPSASLLRAGRRYQPCNTFVPKGKRQKSHKPGRTAAEEMPRGAARTRPRPRPVLPRSGAAASRRKPSAQLLRS